MCSLARQDAPSARVIAKIVNRTEAILSMTLSKQELRQRFSQLNAVMCEWDPIGVMTDPNWPRDEYECLVGPLLTLLQSGASDAEIVGTSEMKLLSTSVLLRSTTISQL